MDLEVKVKKMGLGHEQGFGAPCLKCKEKCEGFELHFWRKICRNCKCGQEEHDVLLSNEEDRKVGKLFEDTKYTTLIAKLKTDGIPMYKRNVMILTNPVAAKKNVSINTVTYEWAPPVQNQALVNNKGKGSLLVKILGLLIKGSPDQPHVHYFSETPSTSTSNCYWLFETKIRYFIEFSSLKYANLFGGMV
uniref:PET domain-containing protein n=1 Tax=Suricata suricatta TaxID=37032 RepID=A0A673VSA1_SURSU